MCIRRNVFYILAIVIGVTFTACESEEQIRAQVLKKIPLGAKIAQVRAFCASEKLKCNFSEDAGFLNQRTGKIIGTKSAWAVLYERTEIPLTITSVAVYWGFDGNGQLIDVWIWKTIDAP
jgi:hypothetical protein